MHLSISEMYNTLLDGFPELLNVNCLPPSFELDQADEEFLLKSHVVFESGTINLTLQLIRNAVCPRDTQGGGLNLSIR